MFQTDRGVRWGYAPHKIHGYVVPNSWILATSWTDISNHAQYPLTQTQRMPSIYNCLCSPQPTEFPYININIENSINRFPIVPAMIISQSIGTWKLVIRGLNDPVSRIASCPSIFMRCYATIFDKENKWVLNSYHSFLPFCRPISYAHAEERTLILVF